MVENSGPNDRNLDLQLHYFQFDIFSACMENNFQSRINELETYADNLLNRNLGFDMAALASGNLQVVQETKAEFKQCSSEILRNIKKKFEDDRNMELLPERFLGNLVEETKQRLFLSYTKLMQTNLQQITSNQYQILFNTHEVEEVEPEPRKKLKPGKNKFPKKAREILNAWYKAHADDPFPSLEEKQRLAEECEITMKQVNAWFINFRRKRWKEHKSTIFKSNIEEKLVQNLEAQEPRFIEMNNENLE